jgi:hypothetical protein
LRATASHTADGCHDVERVASYALEGGAGEVGELPGERRRAKPHVHPVAGEGTVLRELDFGLLIRDQNAHEPASLNAEIQLDRNVHPKLGGHGFVRRDPEATTPHGAVSHSPSWGAVRPQPLQRPCAVSRRCCQQDAPPMGCTVAMVALIPRGLHGVGPM